MTYHWGGTDAVKVHLAVKSDWSLKTLYDVIATLKGDDLSRPVDRARQPPRRLGDGRGRSADRPGRADGRGQGARAAHRQGWRPGAHHRLRQLGRRGAEAAGLDRMGRDPRRRAQAQGASLYINTDNNGRGFLYAEGNHDLQHFVNQARTTCGSADRRSGRAARPRGDPGAALLRRSDVAARRRRRGQGGGDLPLGPLGSGSDYSAFLQHLGIRRSTSASAARISPAAATTRSTTTSTTTCTSSTRASPMARRCRRSSAGSSCARPTRRAFPARYSDFAETRRTTSTR